MNQPNAGPWEHIAAADLLMPREPFVSEIEPHECESGPDVPEFDDDDWGWVEPCSPPENHLPNVLR